jgi:RND family efflux transporter MFP subunit
MTGFKKIYAPYTGTIGARNLAKATTGSLINAGSHDTTAWLYRIYRVDPARVYVAVPQNYLPMIHDGADAEVLLREYPDRIFKGKITRNASVLDPASRTMLVEVQVPNPDNVLLAGMYTTVRFSLDVQQPPVVVPGAAVIMGAEGTRIAVVDKDNVVTIREVRLGRDFGKTVEIVAGCVEGEQIVLSPSDLLRTGQKVRVAPLTPAAKK